VLRAALGSRLVVSGAATLDGGLTVTGDATDGLATDVLSFGSRSGAWASTTLPTADGLVVDLSLGDSAATVTAHLKPNPLPDPTVTPVPIPPTPDPPVPGKKAVIEQIKGEVSVKPPSGGGFTPVTADGNIPNGSIVDTRKGTVTITTASSYTDPEKAPTSVTVSAAIFKVRQVQAAATGTAVTDLLLQTPKVDKQACTSRKGVPRTHTVRRIVAASAKGVVRTFARAAVLTTTRGAAWEMRDRCDGTLASVRSGRAKLFDRIRGHRRTLKARQRLLVKAHLFALERLRLKKVPKP